MIRFLLPLFLTLSLLALGGQAVAKADRQVSWERSARFFAGG